MKKYYLLPLFALTLQPATSFADHADDNAAKAAVVDKAALQAEQTCKTGISNTQKAREDINKELLALDPKGALLNNLVSKNLLPKAKVGGANVFDAKTLDRDENVRIAEIIKAMKAADAPAPALVKNVRAKAFDRLSVQIKKYLVSMRDKCHNDSETILSASASKSKSDFVASLNGKDGGAIEIDINNWLSSREKALKAADKKHDFVASAKIESELSAFRDDLSNNGQLAQRLNNLFSETTDDALATTMSDKISELQAMKLSSTTKSFDGFWKIVTQ